MSPTPKGLDGISFASALKGEGKFPEHDFLYWEFSGYGGQQAVQAGEWKAVRQAMAKKVIKTELYNLKSDPSESTDVAAKHPEIVKKLEALLAREHTPSKDFPLPSIDPKK
jgi:arylsulfatase A